MAAREALHRLVDQLLEDDLPTAARVLRGLKGSAGSAEQLQASPTEQSQRTPMIVSPRLVHADQASDFKKEILETLPDAGV